MKRNFDKHFNRFSYLIKMVINFFKFRKQSMIETYMAFVDNFTLAKQAIIQARTKPSFEKYYMVCRF